MFADRNDAGDKLVAQLQELSLPSDTIILGITRGGVLVASAIAARLGLALDILVIKKIGAKTNKEYAIGAVGPEGVVFWEKEVIEEYAVSDVYRDASYRAKREEQEHAEQLFRKELSPLPLSQKPVLLVDDGIATGATIHAAVAYLRTQQVRSLALAVPVIARQALMDLVAIFEHIAVLVIDRKLEAVGRYYTDFTQVTDDEVIAAVQTHRKIQ
jgi:putative phosphoribosyl transferase